MPASEFTYWMAYAKIEPWGTEVDDWRMNWLLAAAGRKGEPLKASGLYLPSTEQSQDEQMRLLEAAANGNSRDDNR